MRIKTVSLSREVYERWELTAVEWVLGPGTAKALVLRPRVRPTSSRSPP